MNSNRTLPASTKRCAPSRPRIRAEADVAPLPNPAEATAAIRSRVAGWGTDEVFLAAAGGRVLATTVRAERDQPPFDRVTMDGVGLASRAWASGRREYRIVATQAAGTPPTSLPDESSCIEVMTGAVLPKGCDCVVPVEQLRVERGTARIAEAAAPRPGLNVHLRAADGREGDELLVPGTRLAPPEIAIIASAGLAAVAVAADPRIVVISTGDELVEPGLPVADWQIRRSNAWAVLAAVRRAGFARLGEDHLPDRVDVLRERLAVHLAAHDVVILSGGVSMGRFDHVPAVLADLGVERILHKVAQRPGKPLWFGMRGPKAVFALPGNPVSTLVCCARYVIPALREAQGAAPLAPMRIALDTDAPTLPRMTTFIPARFVPGATGPVARLQRTGNSGDFLALRGSDGFVEIGPADRPLAAGTLVEGWAW